jgi:hypothetical protein
MIEIPVWILIIILAIFIPVIIILWKVAIDIIKGLF